MGHQGLIPPPSLAELAGEHAGRASEALREFEGLVKNISKSRQHPVHAAASKRPSALKFPAPAVNGDALGEDRVDRAAAGHVKEATGAMWAPQPGPTAPPEGPEGPGAVTVSTSAGMQVPLPAVSARRMAAEFIARQGPGPPSAGLEGPVTAGRS